LARRSGHHAGRGPSLERARWSAWYHRLGARRRRPDEDERLPSARAHRRGPARRSRPIAAWRLAPRRRPEEPTNLLRRRGFTYGPVSVHHTTCRPRARAPSASRISSRGSGQPPRGHETLPASDLAAGAFAAIDRRGELLRVCLPPGPFFFLLKSRSAPPAGDQRRGPCRIKARRRAGTSTWLAEIWRQRPCRRRAALPSRAASAWARQQRRRRNRRARCRPAEKNRRRTWLPGALFRSGELGEVAAHRTILEESPSPLSIFCSRPTARRLRCRAGRLADAGDVWAGTIRDGRWVVDPVEARVNSRPPRVLRRPPAGRRSHEARGTVGSASELARASS